MDQAELLTRIVNALRAVAAPYAITGSQASIAYGEARFTNDIDVLVRLTSSDLPEFLSHFPADEFYVSEDAARSAVSTGGQFNIIHPASAQKVDVIVAANRFDDRALARAREVPLLPGGTDPPRFIAPEDLILKKMEFFREGGSEKHLRDIAGMLRVSGDVVDLQDIARSADELGLTELWTMVLQRLAGGNATTP